MRKAQKHPLIPFSIEQYNKELDEADAEMDRGAFYTQEEVEQRAKSW
ncbi:MAG: hypothetical protein AAGA66_19580 [Bacteroidota bacterium]